MTPALLSLTAGAWADVLDIIPDAWLARAFKHAQTAHRGTYPLAASEVADAWDALLTERQQAASAGPDRQLPAGPVRVCATCSGRGWLVDRAYGTPAHRDMYQCPDCSGPALPNRGPEDYTVSALLVVLQEWCAEHRDSLVFPVRLAYALACKHAGAPPYDLRRLLDSTQGPTLYQALTALDIAVDPPPAAGTHHPASIGAALETY